jgi:hypothetical protein
MANKYKDEDFPLFICRPGGDEEAWGCMITAGSAVDQADLDAKLADGWYMQPGDWEKRPAKAKAGA